ncbi:MAG: 50S ribosomal protein L29 [Gammaproteobacteria bacterium]|nr:50S ribosomal protein L29 [Gammaproteobacteria bacterium]
MKASDLTGKSAAELKEQLIELRKEQFNLRLEQASGQMAQPHRVKQVRRDIARVKTVLGQQAAAQ